MHQSKLTIKSYKVELREIILFYLTFNKQRLWGHVNPKVKGDHSENDFQNNEFIFFEMLKQKERYGLLLIQKIFFHLVNKLINTLKRLSQMKKQMEKQTEFLRLIVQKIQIKSEDEYTDDEDFTLERQKLQRKSNEFYNNTKGNRFKNVVLKSLLLPKK